MAEIKEQHKEHIETQKPFAAEIPYNGGIEWQANVRKLLQAGLLDTYEKYKDHLGIILNYIERNQHQLTPHLSKIRFLELKNGVIKFKDERKKELVTFDVNDGLNEIRERTYIHNCELCRRRSRGARRLMASELPEGDLLNRYIAAYTQGRRPKPPGTRPDGSADDQPGAPPPSPQQIEAQNRLQQILDDRGKNRQEVLASIIQFNYEEEEPHHALIPSNLETGDTEDFARQWPFLDHSDEIWALFNEKPEGDYSVNPFESQKWKPENLRLLLDGQTKLHSTHVAEAIYNDRFGDFKKNLAETGIPKEVIELLEQEPSWFGKIPGLGLIERLDDSSGDNLIVTYQRLKKINDALYATTDSSKLPDKLKPLYAHREHVKRVVNILGDYIVYINRLVNLVGKLKYRRGAKTQDRMRTAREYTRDAQGNELKTPENEVKHALHEIFLHDAEAAREYGGELEELLIFLGFSDREDQRPITFYDLNGRTATLTGDWFKTYQSPGAAYLAALQEIEEQKKPDGTFERTFDREKAKNHLNDLLQLGIAAYAAHPGEKSLKSIIDDLSRAGAEIAPGVPLRFQQNRGVDLQNLFAALMLKDLNDLYKKDSDMGKMKDALRTKFTRIGSVIRQNMRGRKQEMLTEEMERKSAKIKFTENQADAIIAKLRETEKFDSNQLAEIKRELVGAGIIILPDRGGAFAIQYQFKNGVTLDIGGAFPGWEKFAPGAAIGKKFEINKDTTAFVTVGVTYIPGVGAAAFTGVGGRRTVASFSAFDLQVEAGAGVVNGAQPVAFVGAGIDFARSQEKYEQTLNKMQIETHIKELDQVADKYDEVKKNPEKYPEMSEILYRVENTGLPLDETSRRALFEECYERFREGIQGKAVDESQPGWWRYFTPAAVRGGYARAGGQNNIYAYVELNLWSRNVVYRVSTDVSAAEQFADAQATAAILASCSAAKKIEEKTLRMSGELIIDPATGNLMLKKQSGSGIDFSKLDRFNEFKRELSENAKIFVEPAENGLVLLQPQEAYGNVRVFVDPALGEDVLVVPRKGRLYLSVKKDKEIFVKREDISYPFAKDAALEDTAIFISANPHLTREVIEESSSWYAFRTPKTEWQIKPRNLGETPEEREKRKQINVVEWENFVKWWGTGRIDRLDFADSKHMQAAYDRLVDAVSYSSDGANPKIEIRKEVSDKVQALAKDAAFIQEYRRLSTEGYDVMLKSGKISANWYENFPELVRLIKSRVAPDMNALELNSALFTFLIASFQDLQKRKPEDAKKEYKRVQEFERQLLQSIFERYYANEKDSTSKAKKAVDFIMAQFETIDLAGKGNPVPAGMLFGSLVGMGKITGIRHLYNYTETKDAYGVLNEKTLDVTAKDISGEVAKFWVRKLSPYLSGLGESLIPPPEKQAEYAAYQNKMHQVLRSPLALKLVPLISVILTPLEMMKLTEIYESGRKTPRVEINQRNIDVVKKFLGWCDKVREAELRGEKKVDLPGQFAIRILDFKVSIGVYKKCGNITGLLRESFALVHEGSKQIYFAGYGEGLVDIEGVTYTRKDFGFMLGLALPLPRQVSEVKPEPEPEPEPRPQPQPEPKPEPTPPLTTEPEIPTAVYEPQPVPTAKSAPSQPNPT